MSDEPKLFPDMNEPRRFRVREDYLQDWEHKKEKAMARADAHATDEWKDAADAAILRFAETRAYFSAWEVTVELRKLDIETPTDRAIGPRMIHAARLQLIEKTDHHENNPLAETRFSPFMRKSFFILTLA